MQIQGPYSASVVISQTCDSNVSKSDVIHGGKMRGGENNNVKGREAQQQWSTPKSKSFGNTAVQQRLFRSSYLPIDTHL